MKLLRKLLHKWWAKPEPSSQIFSPIFCFLLFYYISLAPFSKDKDIGEDYDTVSLSEIEESYTYQVNGGNSHENAPGAYLCKYDEYMISQAFPVKMSQARDYVIECLSGLVVGGVMSLIAWPPGVIYGALSGGLGSVAGKATKNVIKGGKIKFTLKELWLRPLEQCTSYCRIRQMEGLPPGAYCKAKMITVN